MSRSYITSPLKCLLAALLYYIYYACSALNVVECEKPDKAVPLLKL
jgi:hypothetical protein